MTTNKARGFLLRVRSDAKVRDRIAASGASGLADVVEIAAGYGEEFTAADLEEAWRQDWALRAIAAGLFAPPPERRSSDRASAE